MNTQLHSKLNKQQGISLVELMVAMVLGLIMTAAVMQTYLSTKQTYNITNGISRLQENARFGHYFITKDLREAGNQGCITNIRNMLNDNPPTDYLAFDKPVVGWEFAGTGRDDSYSISAALTTPAASLWDGNGDLPSFLVGDAIAGSDVLAFKSYEKMDLTISDTAPNSTNRSRIDTVSTHSIPRNTILLVGDCLKADLFQQRAGSGSSRLSGAATGSSPGNDSMGGTYWGQDHDSKSEIFQVVTTYYFIQEGASGLPSLFRLRSITSPVDEDAKEELVEGVESMQAYYGIDTDADNVPNYYTSANTVSVANWDNVVSIRIGLLFRSDSNASDVDQAASYTLLDNISLTHAAADNVLRYSINSTIKLRNRGLPGAIGSDLVCNAPEEC